MPSASVDALDDVVVLVIQRDGHFEGRGTRDGVPLLGRDLEDQLRTIQNLGFESRLDQVDHLFLGAGVKRSDVAARNTEVALKQEMPEVYIVSRYKIKLTSSQQVASINKPECLIILFQGP